MLICACYQLLCLCCCIFRAHCYSCDFITRTFVQNYFPGYTHKLIQLLIFSPNFSPTSFIERFFDANTLFRLYLPISSSDYWQCPKSAAFHIKLAEAPTFPHVTFYDKNKVQIGNFQSGDKMAAIKLTVVFTNKNPKLNLSGWKKNTVFTLKLYMNIIHSK